MEVIRTERGWAGHFICADRCRFRRNTLLECGDVRIVVSTVGAMGQRWIGHDRYYETMAFHAKHDGVYWDANVSDEVQFDSPWAVRELNHESDRLANEMHENVVAELTQRLANTTD